MPGHRRLIRHHSEPTSIVLADLRGLEVKGVVDKAQAEEISSLIDVRDGALQLDADAHKVAAMGWAARLAFNETMLAPKRFETFDGVASLTLGLSTYARFRAARDQFIAFDEADRVRAMLQNELGTPLGFTHTLGVNCTLETSDAKLLTTRRSSRNASGAGMLSVAMSEASNYDDCDGSIFDPLTTALRGFAEELGLSTEDIVRVTPHSLVADAHDGGISILAHAVTRLDSGEVVRKHTKAPDGHEAAELRFDDFTLQSLSALVEANEEWVPWGIPAMLGMVGLRFGDEAAWALEARTAGRISVA